ncbi:hypothetical protein GCM10007989_12450 [Devosia pacifica]|uniref:Hemerythrin-like domain-containing protein n=1 Tax=Devosia pacifica TaxID=1335967 RepID=A0A918VRG7_9HYPH|nr:hemerythrin domain-containing protein [Devosia pacifica]GHA18651.1 hypothetical protein GCM10007989_12450 [Devosia pacifica]
MVARLVQCCTDGANLATQLDAMHADQQLLCERLEVLADALPDAPHQGCLHVARTIGPLLHRAQALEEEALFPYVSTRWKVIDGVDDWIERLKCEHIEDTCYAEELSEALLAYGRGDAFPTPDALGYMLRGFISGLRRHLAFEQDVLVPLLREQRPEPLVSRKAVPGASGRGC